MEKDHFLNQEALLRELTHNQEFSNTSVVESNIEIVSAQQLVSNEHSKPHQEPLLHNSNLFYLNPELEEFLKYFE